VPNGSFRPFYNPDLNPIDGCSKVKTLLRKGNARTIVQIEKCIAKLIQQVDQAECLNYIQEAGYVST
jgi:transposase